MSTTARSDRAGATDLLDRAALPIPGATDLLEATARPIPGATTPERGVPADDRRTLVVVLDVVKNTERFLKVRGSLDIEVVGCGFSSFSGCCAVLADIVRSAALASMLRALFAALVNRDADACAPLLRQLRTATERRLRASDWDIQ